MPELDPADAINQMIDEATNALAFDTPEKAAEALQELAYVCAKGGRDGQEMFEQLRKLVITGAETKTDKIFIAEKLQVAEQKLMEQRNDSIIIH
jgi:hypothetical protein